MTNGTITEDVSAYLDAVRHHLRDLPAAERDELLADVEPGLFASAEETDAPVEMRLGPPDAFAAALREAAGLPRSGDRPAPRRAAVRRRAAAVEGFLDKRPALRRLAPLWWVLRGLVLVVLLERLYDELFATGISPFGGVNHARDLALLIGASLIAVVVSVIIGRRRARTGPFAVAVNVTLLAAGVVLSWHVASATYSFLAT